MNRPRWFNPLWLLFLSGILTLLACHDEANVTLVSRFNLKVATPFLNADGTSQLTISWEMFNNQAQETTPLHSSPEVYANGVLLANPRYYSTSKPGLLTLEAHYGSLISPPLSITVRSPQTYPLIRLPVIFHLAKQQKTQVTGDQLRAMLDTINVIYRNQRANPDPNNADSFIEFYPASKNPDGLALTEVGLNQLDFDDPSTDEQSGAKVDSIIQRWCVKQYINVFVGIDWLKQIYQGRYNYSYIPPYPSGPYLGDPSCGAKPAIRAAIRSGFNPNLLAHEFGHMLGLTHTFRACGSGFVDLHVLDTPRQEEARPDKSGNKVSCNRVDFAATNVMDYYNKPLGFTHDQVRVMRAIIGYPTYLPIKGVAQSGRTQGRQASSPSAVSLVVCQN